MIAKRVHLGGMKDGIWRECEIIRDENGEMVVAFLTVFYPGDEPIVQTLGLTPEAFGLFLESILKLTFKH